MTSATGSTLSLRGFALALGALLGAQTTGGAQTPPLPPPGQSQQALQQAIMQNPGLADSLRRRLQASGLTPEQITVQQAQKLLDSLRFWGALDRNFRYVKGAASNDPETGLRAVAALRALTERLEFLQIENARNAK